MMTDLKMPSPKLKLREGKHGGNRKPQTFRKCKTCGVLFGPLKTLSQFYCSKPCGVRGMSGRKSVRKTIPEARKAQRQLAYQIQIGNIIRPVVCEECKATGSKIEGAHYSYDEPLNVRWLCKSCHVKWDKANPKNVTYRVCV